MEQNVGKGLNHPLFGSFDMSDANAQVLPDLRFALQRPDETFAWTWALRVSDTFGPLAFGSCNVHWVDYSIIAYAGSGRLALRFRRYEVSDHPVILTSARPRPAGGGIGPSGNDVTALTSDLAGVGRGGVHLGFLGSRQVLKCVARRHDRCHRPGRCDPGGCALPCAHDMEHWKSGSNKG